MAFNKHFHRAKITMILTLVLVIFSTPTQAFFRDLCFNPLGYGRIDPIIFPGKTSPHLHHLHGSGNLGINSVDADYLLESHCTSCSITADKSGYWTPAMYFQHTNGTLELLTTAGSLTIYYKTEKRANFENQNYTAFPKGFRMVAGDPLKRAWVGPWPIPQQSWWGPNDTTQEALASKALGFNCMNYNAPGEATFAYSYIRDKAFTDAKCLNGIRAEILFPSCWDGVNLDSPDHKSHVAYPTLLQDGACPITHPIFLPILFYETIWNTQQFIGVPGRYVLSNGDPTGYGYHGDFLAAWEDGILEQVMADPTCTDQHLTGRVSDGQQEKCSVFAGRLQSPSDAAQCKLAVPEKMIHEKFSGQLSILPGNMPITGLRHNPGTNPDDHAAPIYFTPSYVAEPMQPAPTETKPAGIPSHSSTFISPSANTSLAHDTTTQPPTTSTPSVNQAAGLTSITTTYVSNGVWYELVEVIQVVTVTNVVPASTAKAVATHTRRQHTHGRIHV